MQRVIFFFAFIGCCFALFSQNTICVDGSAGGSQNGTPENPYHTIQVAVEAASNGDVIKVAKGTYSEFVQINQKKVQLLGGFAGSGNFDSADPQANKTIISGTDTSCISIDIDTPISGSMTISGFTICNGQRGIQLSGGWSDFLDNIIIENNIIENNGTQNVKQHGGGIGLEGKDVTIRNNIIRNNIAGRGGGIGRTNDLVNFLIADNLIENNKCYDDHGGGVSIDGSGTITRNIFDGNVAAVPLNYGYGGGIVITNYDTTKLVILSHNIWRNNYAPLNGGAVFVDERAKVRMEHELLYNNKCKTSGSAVYVDESWEPLPSVLEMDLCTVWGNSTDEPGGGAMRVEASIARVQNCIFWNNGHDFDKIDKESMAAILTVNYTLTQQGYAGTGNITSDPLFADAPNGDFHLQSKYGRFNPATGLFVNDAVHSPAIDAGNPASDYSNEPEPNGGRVNLGRYGNTAEASKSGPVGIVGARRALPLQVYPNPTTGELTVSGERYAVSGIEVFDVYGRKHENSPPFMEGWQPKADGVVINISHLHTGIYFLKMGNETVKVIKY
jgi:hypothetical protein